LLENSVVIRGIATPSVGILLFCVERLKGRKIWGRNMKLWEFARRHLERRFFCPSIFLPLFWWRPKAALGTCRHSARIVPVLIDDFQFRMAQS
jgi:hypothetical protein